VLSSSRHTKDRTTWQVADGGTRDRARAFVPDSFRAHAVCQREGLTSRQISPGPDMEKGRPREWRAASLIRPGRPLQNPDPYHRHLSTARHVGTPARSRLRPRPPAHSLPGRGATRRPRHSCQPGRSTGRCPRPPCDGGPDHRTRAHHRDRTRQRRIRPTEPQPHLLLRERGQLTKIETGKWGDLSQPVMTHARADRIGRYERHRGQKAAFESRSERRRCARLRFLG
jgi:hypothetical protein